MARNIYGLDLGTYEIKIFDKKKVRIWREKNVIAMKDKKYIFSVGNEAYKMYEKAPENVEILFPMKNGVIARFDDMQYLLGSLLKTDHQFARGAEYVIAVPTDVTEVEKKAFYDLVMHSEAKAKSVRIVERGLADAVGLGLDVMNETGIFIANFGGGTTELSVLSRGGMVMNRLLKTGGETLDAAIAGRVRRNREFLIGKSTAERLRKEFAVFEDGTADAKRVYGRDLTSGVPAHTEIQISGGQGAFGRMCRGNPIHAHANPAGCQKGDRGQGHLSDRWCCRSEGLSYISGRKDRTEGFYGT